MNPSTMSAGALGLLLRDMEDIAADLDKLAKDAERRQRSIRGDLARGFAKDKAAQWDPAQNGKVEA